MLSLTLTTLDMKLTSESFLDRARAINHDMHRLLRHHQRLQALKNDLEARLTEFKEDLKDNPDLAGFDTVMSLIDTLATLQSYTKKHGDF